MLKPLTKHRIKLTITYLVFLYCFIFSRYKPGASILNGATPFSRFLYVGSLIIFFGILAILYMWSYYKDKEFFKSIQKINKKYLFILIWFIVMVMGARRAVRLLHVFSPIIVIEIIYLKVGKNGLKLIKIYLR